MKVIIDTSVVVSAVIRGRQPRNVVQLAIDRPDIEWIVSSAILAEYKEVLNRKKFNLISEVRSQWFEVFDRVTTEIEVEIEVDFPRDQKDAKFLACALVAKADFLITGDRDFEEVDRLSETQIVSVWQFLELMEEVEE